MTGDPRASRSVHGTSVVASPAHPGSGESPSRAVAAPAFARSCGRWLRAYPRRWRAERADEVTAVLVDLAPPGARRLDARTAVGLVVAGWSTRRRTRPPLRPWLAYRLLDRGLDAAWHGWLRDDVEGPWYPARVAWVPFLLVAPVLVPVTAVLGGLTGWWADAPALALVGAAALTVVTHVRASLPSSRAAAAARWLGTPPGDVGRFRPYVELEPR